LSEVGLICWVLVLISTDIRAQIRSANRD